MKGRFRLAAVLRVARLREEAERRRLAAEAAVEARAGAALEERRAAYADQPEPGDGPAGDFLAAREVGRLRAEAVEDARVAARDASARLAAARDRWRVEARQARSLEQLEDRERAARAALAARAAQRALDDLSRRRRRP